MNKNECPLGGDNTDCGSCIYGADYKWNEEFGDCELIDKEEDEWSIKLY